MPTLNQLEFGMLDWISLRFQSDFLDMLMPKISFLGSAGWIWILAALLFMFRKPHRKIGLSMLLALLLSFLVGNLMLKPLVARPRPYTLRPELQLLIPAPTDFSFPSGHTQASFAAASALYRLKKIPGLAALFLAALIAFSRLYLNVHFPGDVLAGAVIGMGLGYLADMLIHETRYRYNAKKRKKRKGGR